MVYLALSAWQFFLQHPEIWLQFCNCFVSVSNVRFMDNFALACHEISFLDPCLKPITLWRQVKKRDEFVMSHFNTLSYDILERFGHSNQWNINNVFISLKNSLFTSWRLSLYFCWYFVSSLSRTMMRSCDSFACKSNFLHYLVNTNYHIRLPLYFGQRCPWHILLQSFLLWHHVVQIARHASPHNPEGMGMGRVTTLDGGGGGGHIFLLIVKNGKKHCPLHKSATVLHLGTRLMEFVINRESH